MSIRFTRTAAVLAALWIAAGAAASTQGRGGAGGAVTASTKNPLEGSADAIRSGRVIFLSRCTGCHGADARGFVGPDLTGLWAAGATDGRLFQIVQRGVPGTEMPPFDIRSQEQEIWQTLAYLRTLNVTEPAGESTTGDAANGERIFRSNCGGCHLVAGRGGELGPDLSRIGAARSRATLKNKIRGAGTIRAGYEPVTLVTREGQRIRGVKKNEDDWTIQIMDTSTRLQGYIKANLAQVIDEKQSVMPAYGTDRINDRDLDDLLRYLGTLGTGQVPR